MLLAGLDATNKHTEAYNRLPESGEVTPVSIPLSRGLEVKKVDLLLAEKAVASVPLVCVVNTL